MSDQSWTPLTPADWAAGLGDAFHQALSNAAGPDQAAPLTALSADQMGWRTLATLLATPGFLEQSPVDAAAAAAGLLGKLDAVRVEAAHRALLAGADVADVRRAVGAASLVELDNQWYRWASERRAAGRLSDDDYRAVAARLDAADDDGAERARTRADDPSASGVRPALRTVNGAATCRRCRRHPVEQPGQPHPVGAFCTECINRCHDSTDFAHTCQVCQAPPVVR